MNTTKQFLTKADYASPLCKTIAVSTGASILTGSVYGEEGAAGSIPEQGTHDYGLL